MSVFQFLRILWAYRFIVVVTTMTSVLLGILAIAVIPPRYQAESRVMLDVIKPDPVTGQVISTNFLRAYTKTQTELIKDQQVARRVVSDLKWATNPIMQRLYSQRDGDEDLDFDRWATQEVMDGTDAKLIEGSNILEISYETKSATRAQSVADALRRAYMDLNLESRRDAARRNAEWYEGQAGKARTQLMEAERQKAEYERQSGIVLQDNQTDIDTARLAALAAQGPSPVFSAMAPATSSVDGQLAAVESQLSVLEKTLGPNHPQLIDLRRQRELLTAQRAKEMDVQGAQRAASAASAAAAQGLLEAQKAKVMSQRDKVERLRLMQGEIDLRRQQYNNAVSRAAQLRQESELTESGAGVTALGAVLTPQKPVFPKKELILGASLAGGFGLGLAISILLEFMGRRVRSAEDVMGAIEAPVLAVIRDPVAKLAPWWTLRRWLPKNVGLKRVARA